MNSGDISPERETQPSADGPSRIDLLEKRVAELQGQLQQLDGRLVEQKVRLATVEALRRGELARAAAVRAAEVASVMERDRISRTDFLKQMVDAGLKIAQDTTAPVAVVGSIATEEGTPCELVVVPKDRWEVVRKIEAAHDDLRRKYEQRGRVIADRERQLAARRQQIHELRQRRYPQAESAYGLPDGTILADVDGTFYIINDGQTREICFHRPNSFCDWIESTNPNPRPSSWTIIYQPQQEVE